MHLTIQHKKTDSCHMDMDDRQKNARADKIDIRLPPLLPPCVSHLLKRAISALRVSLSSDTRVSRPSCAASSLFSFFIFCERQVAGRCKEKGGNKSHTHTNMHTHSHQHAHTYIHTQTVATDRQYA